MTRPLCTCGQPQYRHPVRDPERGLECLEYAPKAVVPGRHTKKVSYRRKARGFEQEVAEAYHSRRLGGVGQIDVPVYDTEGLELLAIECEESLRVKLAAAFPEKYEQAERLSRGRRGGPIPTLAFRAKLGQGRHSERWVLRKLSDDVRLMERLGVFGE